MPATPRAIPTDRKSVARFTTITFRRTVVR